MVPQEAMLRIMTTVFEEQSTTLDEKSELSYDLFQTCVAFCIYFIRVQKDSTKFTFIVDKLFKMIQQDRLTLQENKRDETILA